LPHGVAEGATCGYVFDLFLAKEDGTVHELLFAKVVTDSLGVGEAESGGVAAFLSRHRVIAVVLFGLDATEFGD
jgi:hypothetical protein